MVGRVVNVLIPRQLGIVTDELTGESGQPGTSIGISQLIAAKMPWVSLLVYVLLRFMQGNMGIVGAIRSYMWIPIGQVTLSVTMSLMHSTLTVNSPLEHSNMSIPCPSTFTSLKRPEKS
jgi:hypothetical protein